MNTIRFLNSIPINRLDFCADITALRSKLFKFGIYWTDDSNGVFEYGKDLRVILYTRNADFKNPMANECNGLIVRYSNDTWKLLAMPPRAFCTNKISIKKLEDLYQAGSYDTYEVLDATILTLYFYKNEWRVSSTKGYDITSTIMVGDMTFMDAIKDLIDTKYKSFNLEDLDRTLSYTIALRHSKYHIFDETKYLASRTKQSIRAGVDMNSYIMIVKVADTETGMFINKHVAGVPTQMPISSSYPNVKTLNNYARSAYEKYEKAHNLQEFKYKPLYGYILRAKKKNVPNDYSTVYIESELYRAIKIGLYKNNTAIKSMDYDLLAVEMLTMRSRYQQFKVMFQQLKDKFEKLEKVITDIGDETVKLITQGDGGEPSNKLTKDLANKLKSETDITPTIIHDILYTKAYKNELKMML